MPFELDYATVGPMRSTGVKVIVQDGPSKLILDGPKAMSRLLMARTAAGTHWDAKIKESVYNLDEAARRPFPLVADKLRRSLDFAGLEARIDSSAAQHLEDRTSRVLARYSRWWPQEDGGWEFDPGTIDPALKAEVAAGLAHLGWDNTKELFDFAFDDVSEMGTKDDVMLGPTMGSGKSRMFLALSEYWRYRDKTTTPTIILALKRHLDPWREELGGIKGKEPCSLLMAMYGEKCYEEWLSADVPKFDKPFLLISIERLKRLPDEHFELLQSVAATSTVGIDEAYIIANLDSQQTRAAFRIRGKHHVGITGTPMKSAVGQMLPILQWVFRGGSIALPEYPSDRAGSLRRWKAKFETYATEESSGQRKRVPFVRNIEELHEILAPLMKRRLRGEPDLVRTLGPSEIIPQKIGVDLDPLHRSNYRAVLKQFTEWYLRERAKRGEGRFIPTSEILIKLGYLIWNVSAPWRMEDHTDEEFVWPAYPKQLTAIHEKAIEIVEREIQQGNRVLLTGRSTEALDLMGAALNERGIPSGIYHGKISDQRRAEIVYQCRRGDLPVMVGSMGTVSEALNLSFANRVIVTEYPWDPSQLAQLLGRITRGVQLVPPEAYWLYGKGTIQEYMMAVCSLKSDAISAVLDRTAQSTDTNKILDLTQYVNTLVGIEGEEQLERRLFDLELD